MGKAKLKLKVPPGYWVKPYTLDQNTRRFLNNQLSSASAEFFKAVESAIEDLIAWRKFKPNVATSAEVNAALKVIDKKARELSELLDERRGIDLRTRNYIDQISYLRGLPDNIIDDSNKSLIYLSAAVQLTQDYMKGKSHSGHPKDSSLEEFVIRLYEIFYCYGFKPKASISGKFEKCVLWILDAIKMSYSVERIHQLTVTAAKRQRLNNPPENRTID